MHWLPICVWKYSKSAEEKWVDQGKDGKNINNEDGLSPHCLYRAADNDDGDDNYR